MNLGIVPLTYKWLNSLFTCSYLHGISEEHPPPLPASYEIYADLDRPRGNAQSYRHLPDDHFNAGRQAGWS